MMEKFYNLEKKYRMFEKSYKNFDFWNYARNMVAWQVQMQYENLQQAHVQKKFSRWDNIKIQLKNVFSVISNNTFKLKHSDVLFVAHPRRIYDGKVYESIYTDPIAEQFQSKLSVESSYQGMHFRPIPDGLIVYLDYVEFKTQMYSAICEIFYKNRVSKLKQFFKKEIQEFINQVEIEYGVNLDIDLISQNIFFLYCSHYTWIKYYKKILRKVTPKIIVEVVSYSLECKTLNEVAYDLDIPTVELQHGLISKSHFGYNFLSEKVIRQFPKYLFLFSDYWRNSATYPINQENILSVGFPYLEKQVDKYRKKENNGGQKTISLLSSGPIGKKLESFALFLRANLSQKEYKIIVKLHPGDCYHWQERYPELENSDIEVVDNNNVELYYLFSKSDFLISGFNSTTIVEGVFWGARVLVYDYLLDDEIIKLQYCGDLELFKDKEELLDMILNDKENSKKQDSSLWKTQALDNAVDAIKKIMSKYN